MAIDIQQLRADVDPGIKRVSYENLARAYLDLHEQNRKLREALEWQASQPEAHPFMAQHARAALEADTLKLILVPQPMVLIRE